jgi:hypothetical protein
MYVLRILIFSDPDPPLLQNCVKIIQASVSSKEKKKRKNNPPNSLTSFGDQSEANTRENVSTPDQPPSLNLEILQQFYKRKARPPQMDRAPGGPVKCWAWRKISRSFLALRRALAVPVLASSPSAPHKPSLVAL